MKANIFVICLTFYLVTKESTVDANGGSCWAAPAVLGPVCQSDTAVFGSAGYQLHYKVIPAESQVTPLICCEGKGYSSNSEVWVSIGCAHSEFTGSVPWGNSAATPAIRCRGIPTGLFVRFTH